MKIPAFTTLIPEFNGLQTRKIHSAGHFDLILISLDKGAELPDHTANRNACIQILEGEIEFSITGETHVLRAGDLFCFEAGEPHNLRGKARSLILLTK